MAALVAFIFSSRGLLATMAVAAAWLALRPGSRSGRRFLLSAATVYVLAGIYLVPYSLSRALVVGYHEISARDIPPGRTAIVLLNAANLFVEGWKGGRLTYLDRVGAARTWEGYRVYRLAADGWFVVSEGLPAVGLDMVPSGAAKRDRLIALGVPAARILVDRGARTTREEAVQLAPIVRSLNADHVVLVTSDTHMRRALATFRGQGIDAIPAIARDPELSDEWSEWLVPDSRGLTLTGEVVHETLGLAYYAARGWTKF